MPAQKKLNPQAPEFFPINHPRFCINPLPPSLFPFPNSNSPFYYSNNPPLPSSALFFQFSDSSYSNCETTENSDGHLNTAATQVLNEVPGTVSSGGGRRGGRRWYKKNNWRGRERDSAEQLVRRAKNDGSDYNSINCNNWRIRKNIANSSSRPKHSILPVESNGHHTTLMIRNIPNRYTRELLMEFLDDHCKRENEKMNDEDEKSVSAFDFLYLPMDFKNKVNKGYAFVNFTDPKAVQKFQRAVHNKRWRLFSSNKICCIAYARLQGREELERHFERSVFECEREDYLPVTFRPARDGTRRLAEVKVIGRRVCEVTEMGV